MKKLMMPIVLVLVLFSLQTYAGDDKKAVSETVANELKAYLDKDYDSWSTYWLHEPYVSQTVAGATFYDYDRSWDSISSGVKKDMQAKDNTLISIEMGELDISVSGDLALVYSTEKVVVDLMGTKREIHNNVSMTLKKVEGKWKYVSVTSINKSSYKNNDFNTEWTLNMAGYKLLLTDQVDRAIEVFELNTRLYPDAFNTWDSLAEAHMIKGDTEKSISYYQKSIQLNTNNTHAQEMIDKMQSGS